MLQIRRFSTSTPAKMKVVCVGGVAGGATAAARLRRLDEKANITVFERGPDVSFANCGLPYYVGQEIKDRNKLLLHTPTSLSAAIAVDVKAHHEVLSIDRAKKTVRVQPAGGSPLDVSYDKLLLSTGAAPARPPIIGVRASDPPLPHVFTMRTLADADGMKARVDALGGKGTAVVIGAGFIGLEVVEALVHRGMRVILVEARDHILPIIDVEMVTSLTNDIRQQGVQIITGDVVQSIALDTAMSSSQQLRLHLRDAGSVTADMVLLATGVVPETGLARVAGLELDPRNGSILVNEHLQTSDTDIYAVGDAVSAPCLLFPQTKVWVPLGGPANRQGRLAAEHMVMGDKADKYRGTLGTSIVRAFNTSVGMTGMTEAMLKSQGKAYDTVTVSGYSHASYYPGAQPVTVKVLFDPSSRRLLGGQVFGGLEGVDKRLDILATGMLMGGSVDDLAHLELSYAPPFGSARDVINTVGFAAQNMAKGMLQPARGLSSLPADRIVLDVRDRMSAKVHPVHMPDTHATTIIAANGQVSSTVMPANKVLNVPFDELRSALASGQLDKGASYTTVCNQGKLSYFSARVLEQNGVQVSSLVGGLSLAEGPQPNMAPEESLAPPKAVAQEAKPISTAPGPVVELDACGLACPGPILAIRKTIEKGLAPGTSLVVKASDPGFTNDVKAFARTNDLELVSVSRTAGVITANLRVPGGAAVATPTANGAASAPLATTANTNNTKDVAIVVFSGEMDKVLAALVIANGAVAMGGKATLFFTFWGLPALKKDGTFPDLEKSGAAAGAGSANGGGRSEEEDSHGAHRSALQSMMAKMLPSGPSHLPLSHMNFSGVGPVLMSHVMASQHLPSVKSLMREAIQGGKVRFVACTMSMDALGIPASDLLPQVELGGVADFLSSAGGAHTTLFI